MADKKVNWPVYYIKQTESNTYVYKFFNETLREEIAIIKGFEQIDTEELRVHLNVIIRYMKAFLPAGKFAEVCADLIEEDGVEETTADIWEKYIKQVINQLKP